MTIKFKLLRESAVQPTRATMGSVGYDLRYATVMTPSDRLIDTLHISPGRSQLVPTGLSVALPDGITMLILPRSGMAHKHQVIVTNSPGLIDQDYRGEISVSLTNVGIETVSIAPGDRIAQAVFMPYFSPTWEQVGDLDDTDRGDGGFGSTGSR